MLQLYPGSLRLRAAAVPGVYVWATLCTQYSGRAHRTALLSVVTTLASLTLSCAVLAPHHGKSLNTQTTSP